MPTARILIVDDLESLHADYEKILVEPKEEDVLDSDIFGDLGLGDSRTYKDYELSHAYQGEEAVDLVRAAVAAGRPYAVAFVDVRMPPGIDGIETVRRIWEVDPHVHVVIASAYLDYSWLEVIDKLGTSHRLLTLRKPFDPSEIEQCALALSRAHHIVTSASEAALRSSMLSYAAAHRRTSGSKRCCRRCA